MDASAHRQYRELLLLVSDASRWKILHLLRNRSRTVGELVGSMDIAQPAVSHHLARLRRAGLVESRATGRSRRYAWTVSDPGTAQAELHALLDRWLGAGPVSAPSPESERSREVPTARLEVHLL